MHAVRNDQRHDIYLLDIFAVLAGIHKGKVVVLDSDKEIC